jgi:hypothetical protein
MEQHFATVSTIYTWIYSSCKMPSLFSFQHVAIFFCFYIIIIEFKKCFMNTTCWTRNLNWFGFEKKSWFTPSLKQIVWKGTVIKMYFQMTWVIMSNNPFSSLVGYGRISHGSAWILFLFRHDWGRKSLMPHTFSKLYHSIGLSLLTNSDAQLRPNV